MLGNTVKVVYEGEAIKCLLMVQIGFIAINALTGEVREINKANYKTLKKGN